MQWQFSKMQLHSMTTRKDIAKLPVFAKLPKYELKAVYIYLVIRNAVYRMPIL